MHPKPLLAYVRWAEVSYRNGKTWWRKAICWEPSPYTEINRIKKKMRAGQKDQKENTQRVSLKGVDVHPQLPVLLRGKIERLSWKIGSNRKEHACAHLPFFRIQKLKERAGHLTRQKTNMKDPGSLHDVIPKCSCEWWYAWAPAAKHSEFQRLVH